MVKVCHSGCEDICEEGNCEILVPINEKVNMRTMASLIIELLSAEEIEITQPPKGRLLNALLEVARWMDISVKEKAP
jgi:hypothetical protein